MQTSKVDGKGKSGRGRKENEAVRRRSQMKFSPADYLIEITALAEASSEKNELRRFPAPLQGVASRRLSPSGLQFSQVFSLLKALASSARQIARPARYTAPSVLRTPTSLHA
jgi:hypothetical protein